MAQRPKASNRKEKKLRYFDYTMLFIIIFLVAFGLVMLYSTSYYNAQSKLGDSAYYLKKQLTASLLGFAGLFVMAKSDYHYWLKLSKLIYVVALALCLAVIFKGTNLNGSTRWLKIGPLSFQPSEMAKFAVILFLAEVLSKMPKKIAKLTTVFAVLVYVMPLLIIVASSNLSTAIIIFGIVVCMLFVASPKYLQFFLMAGIVAVFGSAYIIFVGYRAERFAIWLHPEKYEKGYQTLQGLYAIGSGGLFGKGLGESMQKLGFLPEAQNDMIFSIICEELGLFGAICVILLFLLLLWRFLVVANNAKDMEGALIVVGIMSHIAIQVILNIAVVTNSIPNTGVTLPFISYGGTSAAILLTEMGLALSVSRYIKLEMV